MAKIHTHYDNLKVSRMAPQEVIRAAYKALSQKYHPDKNAGDEKAARIMAILNLAYDTLSDPQRRREHDEWIAAEEWEIEWLESTRDDKHQRSEGVAQAWGSEVQEPSSRPRLLRDVRWWLGLSAALAAGVVGGAFLMTQQKLLPPALGSLIGARSDAKLAPSVEVRAAPAELRAAEVANDAWATARTAVPDPGGELKPDVKVLSLTELVVPARAPECELDLHTLVAPNGEPWPAQSGYVEGYPVGNRGNEMEFTIDNSSNASAVFVKLYDMDRRSNVRQMYILPHDSLWVNEVAAGRYEVRYQNVDVPGDQANCSGRKKRADN